MFLMFEHGELGRNLGGCIARDMPRGWDSYRWVCNEAKSHTYRLQWLCLELDLKGCISVPPEKIRALRASLQIVVTQSTLRAKHIASLVGKIISIGLAIGALARFMTRVL